MRKERIVIPDSFLDYRVALIWAKKECETRGVKIAVSYYLPHKQQVYLYCYALAKAGFDINYHDVFDKVGR